MPIYYTIFAYISNLNFTINIVALTYKIIA